jgi:hypothetical protein
MTVDELLHRMSAKEINEWRAFDLINPIGGKRIDYNFAHLIFMLYTMLCGNKNKVILEDFVLDFELPFLTEEEKKQRQQMLQDAKTKDKPTSIDINDVIARFKGMQKK